MFRLNPFAIKGCPSCRVPFQLTETTCNLALQALLDLSGATVSDDREPERRLEVHLRHPQPVLPAPVVHQYYRSDVLAALGLMLGIPVATPWTLAARLRGGSIRVAFYVLPPALTHARNLPPNGALGALTLRPPPEAVQPAGLQAGFVTVRCHPTSNHAFFEIVDTEFRHVFGQAGTAEQVNRVVDQYVHDMPRDADGTQRTMVEWRQVPAMEPRRLFDP
jgi:hypothetical protein